MSTESFVYVYKYRNPENNNPIFGFVGKMIIEITKSGDIKCFTGLSNLEELAIAHRTIQKKHGKDKIGKKVYERDINEFLELAEEGEGFEARDKILKIIRSTGYSFYSGK